MLLAMYVEMTARNDGRIPSNMDGTSYKEMGAKKKSKLADYCSEVKRRADGL